MAQNIESITHSELPWVLLGLRTMPKDGLNHSSADIVYGQPLVVPGEFFPYDSTADQSHAESLRRIVRDLAPCRPSKQHQHTTIYVPAELKSSDCVHQRRCSQTTSIQPVQRPIPGTCKNRQELPRTTGQQEDWISIDRLKPAYLDVDDHNRDVVTRSGRTSRPPLRFDMSHSNRGGM